MAFHTSRFPRIRKRRITSRNPRPVSKADAHLWHLRLGHTGPESLFQLGKCSIGATLRGPKTTECQHCAFAKMKRQISRRPPDRKPDKPCIELHIDWTDLEKAHAGYIRTMYIHDAFSKRSFPYFMTTHGTEKENLRVLKDLTKWMKTRYNLDVKTIRSDRELNRNQTKKWLRSQGISFEPSAARTERRR